MKNRQVSMMTTKTQGFFSVLFASLGVLVTLALSSCGTDPTVRNVNLSYNSIRDTVIHNLPGGLMNESGNGRELKSRYYVPVKADKYILLNDDKAENSPERAFTKVIILGDRRPFSIEVEVYRQKMNRQSHRFYSPSLDDDLTDAAALRIRDALANRREDVNVIDGFRAF